MRIAFTLLTLVGLAFCAAPAEARDWDDLRKDHRKYLKDRQKAERDYWKDSRKAERKYQKRLHKHYEDNRRFRGRSFRHDYRAVPQFRGGYGYQPYRYGRYDGTRLRGNGFYFGW